MNTQMVSVTDLQRNSKKVLAKVARNPLVILRDSIPEAVLLSIEEYKRLTELEKETLKKELSLIMDGLAKKNAKFSDEKIDRDIEYAKKHAPRSRWYKHFDARKYKKTGSDYLIFNAKFKEILKLKVVEELNSDMSSSLEDTPPF